MARSYKLSARPEPAGGWIAFLHDEAEGDPEKAAPPALGFYGRDREAALLHAHRCAIEAGYEVAGIIECPRTAGGRR